MRKRNVCIRFRLTRDEADKLDAKIKKSGLSREAYLRQLIDGLVPQDAPPPDFFAMMRELHAIGNNLNQIAVCAHRQHSIKEDEYRANCELLNHAITRITDAVLLPRKMEC